MMILLIMKKNLNNLKDDIKNYIINYDNDNEDEE